MGTVVFLCFFPAVTGAPAVISTATVGGPQASRARGCARSGKLFELTSYNRELTLVLARIQTGSPTHHLYGRLWGSLHMSWRRVGQKQRLCVFHFEPGKQKEAR